MKRLKVFKMNPKHGKCCTYSNEVAALQACALELKDFAI
jgi:hydroxymethylpyrimidine/phosphomethylpyrimidine kinase